MSDSEASVLAFRPRSDVVIPIGRGRDRLAARTEFEREIAELTTDGTLPLADYLNRDIEQHASDIAGRLDLHPLIGELVASEASYIVLNDVVDGCLVIHDDVSGMEVAEECYQFAVSDELINEMFTGLGVRKVEDALPMARDFAMLFAFGYMSVYRDIVDLYSTTGGDSRYNSLGNEMAALLPHRFAAGALLMMYPEIKVPKVKAKGMVVREALQMPPLDQNQVLQITASLLQF